MARYRYVDVSVTHPLATANRNRSGNLTKMGEHRLLLFAKIGYGPHWCHYCGRPINWAPGGRVGRSHISADHVNGDPRDNRPENLVPACHGCNSIREHPHPLIADEEPSVLLDGKRRRVYERICELPECDETFWCVSSDPKRFCSKSHASIAARRAKYWRSGRKRTE